MELFLIIAVPILIGGVLYWYAMAEKDKQESRCNRLSVLANISTIVAVLLAFGAVIYAMLQYNAYLEELSKAPRLKVHISPSVIPAEGLIRYEDPSAEFTAPIKISVGVVNTGDIVGREVFVTLGLGPNVKVVSIDYRNPRFSIPITGQQIFMFWDPDYPIPPGGIPRRIMAFTIRLKRMGAEQIEIGRLTTQLHGDQIRSFDVFFSPQGGNFLTKPCDPDKKSEIGRYAIQ